MDANPDVEFDHFLAEKLSMTVAQMRRKVSAAEWRSWNVYYVRKAARRKLATIMAGG